MSKDEILANLEFLEEVKSIIWADAKTVDEANEIVEIVPNFSEL